MASSPRRPMDAFMRPRSIAVVGASSDPDTIAGLLFANLVASHFDGIVLPVNKKHPRAGRRRLSGSGIVPRRR